MFKTFRLVLLAVALLGLSVDLSADQIVVKSPTQGFVTVDQTPPYHLFKQNIKKVRIFGTEFDRIHIYITDDQKHTFRIPNLSEGDAEKILERIKGETALVVQAEPVKYQKYMDVVSWK